MKHLSGAPLYGRLLALPTNIRLGWKGSPGTNTLLQKVLTYGRNFFYNIGPRIPKPGTATVTFFTLRPPYFLSASLNS
jgi:hypothetical protein